MSALRKLIEEARLKWGNYDLVKAAEAELEELLLPGVTVPKHQYDEVCRQRGEAFARARAAEAERRLDEMLGQSKSVRRCEGEQHHWYKRAGVLVQYCRFCETTR